MVKATKRLSNIEALRIIAFTMIVTIHVSAGGVNAIPSSNAGWAFANLINGASRAAVDVFVLIGAYFLCAKNLSLKGIGRRWLLLIFPVLMMVVAWFIYSPPGSVSELIGVLSQLMRGNVPYYHQIGTYHLWFVYTFLFLVALSPILNYAIERMDRATYRKALGIIIVLTILPQTINEFTVTSVLFNLNDKLFFFIALYFVAGYIRKFDVRMQFKKAFALWIVFTASAIILCYAYSVFIHVPSTSLNKTYIQFYDPNNLLDFSGAIFLFMAFRQIMLNNKAISSLGKSTYDAFLIHTMFILIMLKAWPVKYPPSISVLDYSTHIVVVIGIVSTLSLGYGLLRYAMDAGIAALLKRAAIGKRINGKAIAMRMNAFWYSTRTSLFR